MEEEKKQGTGVHVKNGQDVLNAMRQRIPHWIHDTRKDPNSINGTIYLPSCTCSVCGFHVNMEKEKCPHCGAKMSEMKGIY